MSYLNEAKRIIVKIGSSLLVDESEGHIRHEWLESLCSDVAGLHAQGKEVIIVSSGAIAVGRHHLNLIPPLKLEEKQAAAAAGQIRLAHAYQEVLSKYGINVAQILLTLYDSEVRRRYLNACNTLETLIKLRAVPLINENDTVATAEIKFGDNDRLAARVAQMVSAEVLVLLSDIDGLYTLDPRKHKSADFIEEVTEITPEIESMAGDPGPSYGSGGMITKLEAAKICLSAGCRMVIAKGETFYPLTAIKKGSKCTWFTPLTEARTARKQWIFGSIKPIGSLFIDDGAVTALNEGKSLLPAGVIDLEGDFHRGDCVLVKTRKGVVLGRGLSAYDAKDVCRILGKKTHEIESILGHRGRDELIHRDDLVMNSG